MKGKPGTLTLKAKAIIEALSGLIQQLISRQQRGADGGLMPR